MSKKNKGTRIKNFSREEVEEILDAEEAMENRSKALRAVKTFTSLGSDALKEASRDQYESEEEKKAGERYQNDLSGLNNTASNISNRVQNIIRDMKRNDLSKSEKERETERLRQDHNIEKPELNRENPNNSPLEKIDKKPLVDKETQINAGPDLDKAAKNKDYLDSAFEKPKKKPSLLDRLASEKNKTKTEVLAKKEAIKKKGIANSFVEKVTGEGAKTIIGTVLKFVFIIILVVLIFALFIAAIFYFSNNYTREQNDLLDARRLDTRAIRAIYAFKEDETIKDLYKDYFATSSGTELEKFKKNYERLIPSKDVVKIRASENPEEAFIMQDSTNWFLLYLERLSYAFGGYLDWKPDYINEGINFANCDMLRNPSYENVEKFRDVATEVGTKYGIDPNILLAVVDLESSGNIHAVNGDHLGLGQLGSDFTSYFEEGEEFKSWTAEMRVPTDIGSCTLEDSNHKRNAEMHFTYIARRLTSQMAKFLKEEKEMNPTNETASEKIISLGFAIAGYNQGEERVLDLYNTYGDALFTDKGDTYANKFLLHVDSRLNGGYKMVDENQCTYLKLFYKFFEYYSNNTLDNAYIDPSKFYDLSNILKDNNDKYTSYLGSVDKEVKLLKDSVELGVINTVKENNYLEMTNAINDEYNRWMSKFDNYYLANYRDKFITDGFGRLIPELFAKDIYGMDTNEVIKHKSYIHEIVSDVTTYETNISLNGLSPEDSYQLLDRQLQSEYNDLSNVSYRKETEEHISDIEKDLAINRYEMSFEALRTVDSNNEMLGSEEAIKLFENTLEYSVPIYEYASTNVNKGYKSFFDYEIYNPNNYNPDFTLKIDDYRFRQILAGVNNINLSMKSFVKYGWSKDGEESILKRTEDAFDYLYLNNNKAYTPSNHYVEVPADLETYFFVVNGNVYSRMVEKTFTKEKYVTDKIDDKFETVQWFDVTEKESDNTSINYYYDGMDAKIVRDYYLPNLAPSKFTSLKYEAVFDYITEEEGDREIQNETPETKIYRGDVYKIVYDELGRDTGERVYDRSIFKKEITKENYYTKEKVRHESISTRGM